MNCDRCGKKVHNKEDLYPLGYWYYDNNGGHHNIGKEQKVCSRCIYAIELTEKVEGVE
tara:strand:+ start:191 stop:364 length:174 start_codon:yes stop_codon:yes gene_type:complete